MILTTDSEGALARCPRPGCPVVRRLRTGVDVSGAVTDFLAHACTGAHPRRLHALPPLDPAPALVAVAALLFVIAGAWALLHGFPPPPVTVPWVPR